MDGNLHIGKNFINFKTKGNSLRDALEKYFNNTLKGISKTIPEIPLEEANDDTDYAFLRNSYDNWTCVFCTFLN